ncbi:hypothetical protein [Streptomyces sp. NBC_01197]|uniref:hypothetical protein n=1 Tax=Streptomyces sp. NBC_01197 TaxID=2903768 RepID=UPI002E0F64E0|nr:hypothetical protein OG452_35120 [Streptomyces sp. NBC_01197]
MRSGVGRYGRLRGSALTTTRGEGTENQQQEEQATQSTTGGHCYGAGEGSAVAADVGAVSPAVGADGHGGSRLHDRAGADWRRASWLCAQLGA